MVEVPLPPEHPNKIQKMDRAKTDLENLKVNDKYKRKKAKKKIEF